MGKQSKSRPERDQVRVWLDTVLNPLAQALEEELAWSGRSHATFREHLRDLEGLLPTDLMVGRRYDKNLRQVQRYEPEFADACEAHDRERETLAQACRAFFERGMEDARISRALAGAGGDPAAKPYFLEYLINGVDELPAHYVLRAQWPAVRDAIREVVLGSELRSELEAVQRALRSFAARAAALRQLVDTMIDRLADEHSLAPVARAG